MAANEEFEWDFLLNDIKDRTVVPVVGRDLVTVERDGKQVDAYAELARSLASTLSIEAEESRSIATVSGEYLKSGGDQRRLNHTLRKLVEELDEGPIPEPLLQLAGVQGLTLFVSTTPDRLLARALQEVRGQEAIELTYKSEQEEDLADGWRHQERAIVYHLLGSAGPDSFATTDEDLLEIIHQLQKHERPRILFDALEKHQLLLIGCRFPDWVIRFFLRATKRARLREYVGRAHILAGGSVAGWTTDDGQRKNPDINLTRFLTDVGKMDVLDEYQAAAFVNDLSDKWQEKFGPEPVSVPQTESQGLIFISYASEDRDDAVGLAEDLKALNLGVWLDRYDIDGGDKWEQTLRENVRNCSLFIPILSKHVIARNEGWFFWEWDEALTRLRRMPPNRKFVLPLVIDDEVPADSPKLPQGLRDLHWNKKPELLDGIVSAYRASQEGA